MEKCEVVYVEEIYKDFSEANLTEKQVLKIDEKLKTFVALSPLRRTESIQNISSDYNIRKTRFGDYRMFLEVDLLQYVITCLTFLHRSKCYDKKNINKAITILTKEKGKNQKSESHRD